MGPINTCDPAAAARGYVALEWPLTLGHRFRPRQGCTCENVNCSAPGAHPALSPTPVLTEQSLAGALETSPAASLIATTERFDAVLVPRDVGMAAMVSLDRVGPVPCLIHESGIVALLVLPATGRYCLVNNAVEVRDGPLGWIALPPSRGVRWDTPPWIEPTSTPRDLISGEEVGRKLRECFNYVTTPKVNEAEVA